MGFIGILLGIILLIFALKTKKQPLKGILLTIAILMIISGLIYLGLTLILLGGIT